MSCRYSERTTNRPSEAFSHAERTSSSPSEETGRARKPSANRGKRRRRNPEWDESQYETEYTTGGETGNELDGEEWERWDRGSADFTVGITDEIVFAQERGIAFGWRRSLWIRPTFFVSSDRKLRVTCHMTVTRIQNESDTSAGAENRMSTDV